MKTYQQFIQEAAQQKLKFKIVYSGHSPDVAKEIKTNKNTRSSEYGVYGPGVYGSSDVNVARHYSGSKTNNTGVVKSRIPKNSYATIRTPEHNHPEGIQKSREIIFGRTPSSVQIKNAASQQERRTHAINKVKGDESDYFVVNPKTFNKGITTSPTIRKKIK